MTSTIYCMLHEGKIEAQNKYKHTSSLFTHLSSSPTPPQGKIINMSLPRLLLDLSTDLPPTRDHPAHPSSLPTATSIKAHPTNPGSENATIFFVGTATTILEWEGVRLMTDPNFLHKGDHVHLGPGVTGTRETNPAVNLHELPRIDVVLLSHYHA